MLPDSLDRGPANTDGPLTPFAVSALVLSVHTGLCASQLNGFNLAQLLARCQPCGERSRHGTLPHLSMAHPISAVDLLEAGVPLPLTPPGSATMVISVQFWGQGHRRGGTLGSWRVSR